MEVWGFSQESVLKSLWIRPQCIFGSIFMKILTEEGRECTPNDPKCSWQPAGVKLKGLALKPEAENNELCKDSFEQIIRKKILRNKFSNQPRQW